MSDLTATRSAMLGLGEERRAMQEGYAFLDEKCVLLAGAMLRELRRLEAARATLRTLQDNARRALAAALARHGLQGLQCYPALPADSFALQVRQRRLLNVELLDSSVQRLPRSAPEAAYETPEAQACRAAFAALLLHLVAMAAPSGNLMRLYRDYRRSVRRVRALQDVLLPELDGDMSRIEAQLEELERDEALGVRWQPPEAVAAPQ